MVGVTLYRLTPTSIGITVLFCLRFIGLRFTAFFTGWFNFGIVTVLVALTIEGVMISRSEMTSFQLR